MAMIHLLGEQVAERRHIDEKTAVIIKEILDERNYQDEKWSGLEGKTNQDVREAALEHDKQWSGTDWSGFMERYQAQVKPDMNDPETRQMFIKIAALAVAALRAN